MAQNEILVFSGFIILIIIMLMIDIGAFHQKRK